MLLNFSITNYRSIKDTVTLSLIAGRERKNSQRLVTIKELRRRVVPVAMIQGKNGAGKSNIIKAIACATRMIGQTRQANEKLDAIPFRLSKQCLELPSRFDFEFFLNNKVYSYSFSIDRDLVRSERLAVMRSNSEIELFSRNEKTTSYEGLGNSDEEKNDLRIILQGTRGNQLYLNSLAQQAENVGSYSWAQEIRDIFKWLTEGILILTPGMSLGIQDYKEVELLTKILPLFDTGIGSLDLVEITVDKLNTPLPKDLIERMINFMPEGQTLPLGHSPASGGFIKKVNGEAHFYEVKTEHLDDQGDKVSFNFADESDGTLRLMSVLAFFSLLTGDQPKTIIIDEIDRSLHTMLTQKIIEDFLAWVEQYHSGQLVFTSHDSRLFDHLDLRRDEIWLVDKDTAGVTTLYPMASKNILRAGGQGLRVGMNLLTPYLDGTLGGVAKLQDENFIVTSMKS